MSKNEIATIDHVFLESVSDVLLQARKNAKTAVNLTMVYAYYEIGSAIIPIPPRRSCIILRYFCIVSRYSLEFSV